MDNELPSAQAQVQPNQESSGIQSRIDELTARFRQAEENNQKLQQQIMEATAREAEAARRLADQVQRANAPVQQPIDPLAAYRDKLDPVAIEALQRSNEAMQRQMEERLQKMQAQYEAQQATFAVRSEIASTPGIPPDVAAKAEQLMSAWRAQGWNVPTAKDAIHIALGQHYESSIRRAAPVLSYQQNHAVPNVTPGFAPPPPTPRKGLPANFDSLAPDQQNLILEQNGVADESF